MRSMKTVTTSDAKARLNALLVEVADGEVITITSHGRPIAVLSAAESPPRTLGAFAGIITLTDDFDAPMSEDDLALWGEAE